MGVWRGRKGMIIWGLVVTWSRSYLMEIKVLFPRHQIGLMGRDVKMFSEIGWRRPKTHVVTAVKTAQPFTRTINVRSSTRPTLILHILTFHVFVSRWTSRRCKEWGRRPYPRLLLLTRRREQGQATRGRGRGPEGLQVFTGRWLQLGSSLTMRRDVFIGRWLELFFVTVVCLGR